MTLSSVWSLATCFTRGFVALVEGRIGVESFGGTKGAVKSISGGVPAAMLAEELGASFEEFLGKVDVRRSIKGLLFNESPEKSP